MRGDVVKLDALLLWAGLIGLTLSQCTPAVSPVPDAGDSGRSPCATDEAITAGHLIRNPNGTPLVLPPCQDQ